MPNITLDKDKRILALPGLEPKLSNALHLRADNSGCGTIRCYEPCLALNAQPHLGWSASCLMAMTGKLLEATDLLLGQRLCTDHVMPFWRAAANHPHCKAVYEIDDNLFEIEPENTEAFAYYADSQIRQNMREAIFISDAVIVSSEDLAAELLHLNKNIYVIPNYINASAIVDELPTQADKVIIGWAGGGSHTKDIETISDPLCAYLKATDKAELHTIGQDYSKQLDVEVRHTGWFNVHAEFLDNLNFDIGLCPLRDSRFNRSKTPIKALEYAARGIPVLAANVTPYRQYVEHGSWGFLYSSPDEFTSYLDLLVSDPALRAEMGTKALAFARAHTYEGRIKERAAIYSAITGRD